MRLTSWLTIATFILLIWQFKARKGDIWHVFRWFLILGTGVAVVVINTSRLGPKEFGDLLQDPFFMAHIFLGLLFFACHLSLPLFGIGLRYYPDLRWWHRTLAHLTLIFWCLSMLATIPLIF